LATNNGVLCIKGKPGAGKSTLMRHTLEYCKTEFSDHLIIAYFFNARGNTLEKTPLGMLRSIVYQLVKADATLFEQFLVRFRDKKIISQGREWGWQQQELKIFITSVIKQWKSKPLLLLVDALDECIEADMQDVVDFIESLSIDAKRYDTILRVCLSRRHHPPLRIAKCLELTVENNEDHQEDIAIYIKEKLAKRDDEIEAEIEKKANGIFMWVVLVVKLLNKASFKVKGKKKAMQDALEKIPSELEEVFRILFNKEDEDMADTLFMLQWVLFAQRPLTPEELYSAVEAGMDTWSESSDIDHDTIQQSIENLSKGLIEIREIRDIRDVVTTNVQFIHLSVNDFLLRNKRLQTLDQTLEPDPVIASHRRLWDCCRSHIEQVSSSIRATEVYKELDRKYSFLKYAASHILDHAEKVLAGGTVGQASDGIGEWLREADAWFEWWKGFANATSASKDLVTLVKDIDMDAGLLYMLSRHGYASLVQSVLAGEGAEVNAQGGEYGNALQTASAIGSQPIVELLLKAGAEVSPQGGYYGTALQAASANGSHPIVELLLKAGAEVNAQGGEYGNALQAASAYGRQQIVELLLRAGAEVNSQGGEFGTALQAASWNGSQQIVELLLNAGAEVNAQGGYYYTALQAASADGSQQIVELLLKASAEVSPQGGYYGTALQAASANGSHPIVELLLKASAEVNAQGGYYGTALQAASADGSQQIVELLLKAGAEVDAQGGKYGNALQAALEGKHHDIAKMLREAGATVTTRDFELEVGNAGEVRMEDVNVRKSPDGVSSETAPDMVSPGTEAPPLGIWFSPWVRGIHAYPRLILLWPGLFVMATGGVIAWLVRGRSKASTFFGGTWRSLFP
jgi:ankyrin repeat protein